MFRQQRLLRSAVLAVVLSLPIVASSPKYVLVSPKQVTQGQDVQVVLHTLEAAAGNPVINVTVNHNTTGTVYASYVDRRIRQGTRFLSVPTSTTWPPGSYNFTVSALDGSFFGSAEFFLSAKSCAIFVQMDKAMYKPSQTVLFRVIVTNRDMKPYDAVVSVRIQDPNGIRIKQWVNVSLVLGVASLDLKLSDKVPLGNWKILVGVENQEEAKTFDVVEDTLPQFQVTLELPNYVLTNQTKVSGSVIARYTYGEDVEGSAIILFSLGSKEIVKNLSINGRATFELSKSDLDVLNITHGDLQSLSALAVVTESLTGISCNGSTSCPVSTHGVVVNFMTATNDYFKPGTNYTAYVQVRRPDGSLLAENGYEIGLMTSFDSSGGRKNRLVATARLPPSGIVQLAFVAPFSNEMLLTATADLGEESIMETKYIAKFNTLSDTSISLSLVNQNSTTYQVSDVLSFYASFRDPSSSWHYTVSARGQILVSATLSTSVTTFRISLSESHVPQATVVAYMVSGARGELVADSITVNVNAGLLGKVKVTCKNNQGQSTSQIKPGENVTLYVEVLPNSVVGLLAVDASSLLLKGGRDFSSSMVLTEMDTFGDNNDGSTVSFDLGVTEPPLGGAHSAYMFANARLSVATDAAMYTSWQNAQPPEDEYPPAETTTVSTLSATELITPRIQDYSSQTWLWALVILNDQGQANVTLAVPDTITSWTTTAFSISPVDGLVVIDEASKLKVFQDVFVSYMLPYSVVRGEEVAFRVVIVNYADHEQRVSVMLLHSVYFAARLNDANTVAAFENLTSEVNVPGNSSRATIFWVTPRVLGSIKLTVFASTRNGVDMAINELLVKPEGMEQGYCLSELVSVEDDEHHALLKIKYPPNVVADSRRVEIQVSGDVMGPSIKGLEKLIQVPYGCGEQNMVTFTPNIFVRRYLDATGRLDPEIVLRTQSNMFLGYQRELTYRRTDHDFSAFGDSDAHGSTWLTAFVFKSFRQALPYLGDSIDRNLLETTEARLLSKQDGSGNFVETGSVIHSDMQGGSGTAEALNAFILIALLEDNAAEAVSLRNVTVKTIALLEKSLSSISSDPYKLAISTYALTLANSSRAAVALSSLESLVHSKGSMLYWKRSSSTTMAECHYWPKPSATSAIEMSSYALLTYTFMENLTKASQVAKWLASQRNSLGGFTSTQDTVVALQALAAFARVARNVDINLDLSFSADGGNVFPEMKVNSVNALLLQTSVAARPDSLSIVGIAAAGRGSAIVSVCVSYYSLVTPSLPLVNLSVTIVAPSAGVHTTTINACASSTTSSQSTSGMGIMKMHLPSGFTAKTSIMKGPDSLRRIDNEDSLGKLALYFDEFPALSKVCVAVPIQASYMVTMVKDAYIVAYHYYMPEQAAAVACNPVTGKVLLATTNDTTAITTSKTATSNITTTAAPTGSSQSLHCCTLLVLISCLCCVYKSVPTR